MLQCMYNYVTEGRDYMTIRELDFVLGFNVLVDVINTQGDVLYLGKWGLFVGKRDLDVIDLSVYRDLIKIIVR